MGILKNYYKILGIESSATSFEIKNAYKKLAKIYHPDTLHNSPNLAAKFAEITEAYNVLGDLDKRLKYSLLLSKDKRLTEKIKLVDYSMQRARSLA